MTPAGGAAFDFEFAAATLFTFFVKGAGFSDPCKRKNNTRPTPATSMPRKQPCRPEARVRTLSRTKFLRVTGPDFGGAKIALLIDAHSARLEQASGLVGQRAPRVEQVSSEVVLDDLRVFVVGSQQIPVSGNVQEID
jgi:hypothetical protein